jgi:hypothetical protein
LQVGQFQPIGVIQQPMQQMQMQQIPQMQQAETWKTWKKWETRGIIPWKIRPWSDFRTYEVSGLYFQKKTCEV